MDDFQPLKSSEHMLKWLAEDPYAEIRGSLEEMVQEQAPGSKVTGIRVTSDPQWLTGGRPSDENPDHVVLVRTGVAFALEMDVASGDGSEQQVRAIYSWVGVQLDSPDARQQIWIDVDGTLEQFGAEGELKSRIYM